MYVLACVGTCMWNHQKTTSALFPQALSTVLFRQGLSLAWDTSSRLFWGSSEAWGLTNPSLSNSQCRNYKCIHHTQLFSVGFWESNLGLYLQGHYVTQWAISSVWVQLLSHNSWCCKVYSQCVYIVHSVIAGKYHDNAGWLGFSWQSHNMAVKPLSCSEGNRWQERKSERLRPHLFL